MKTIPKTSNKAKAILAAATKCECYCLDNNFCADECGAEYAERHLHQSRNAKLRLESPTKATVRVHSNLWYTLTIPEGVVQ